ncbi:MAG TPA: hypothetical protein VFR66_08130 [Burkholderiales bacterium]|nr:hypothetical protein [Burkholderiales bacterium]
MRGKGFIVIHEADDLIRELLERWLGEAGYAVRAAADAPPSLVIADVPSPRGAQPVIESLEAVYAAPIMVLSRRRARDRIPIVLMSGYVGGRIATLAREAGAEDVLKKPLSARDLAASLSKVLHS